MRIAIMAAAAAGIGLAPAMSAAKDVGGRYAVEGTNFDGSRYKGTATIAMTSDATCTIDWQTGSTSSGICMLSGNVLAASYAFAGGGVGLVIYQIHDDGSLTGTWTQAGANGMGTELLAPR